MSFFKRNKKQSRIIEIPRGSITRKIIYDSGCEDPEGVAELMGLTRISEEVAEREIEDSDDRVDRILLILPIIQMHSEISAKVSFAAYINAIPDTKDVDSETFEALSELFSAVALASSVSCLTSMLDLEIIKEMY